MSARHAAMAKSIFNIAAILSTVAFCLIVATWLIAGSFNPRKQFVSISRGCYISIDARGNDVRLEVFNDSTYGPYAGSIVGIAGDPNGPRISGIGDTAGLYYRFIRWPNGTSLWTLALSLFYPAVVTLLLPLIWIVRHSPRRRRGFPVEGVTKHVQRQQPILAENMESAAPPQEVVGFFKAYALASTGDINSDKPVSVPITHGSDNP